MGWDKVTHTATKAEGPGLSPCGPGSPEETAVRVSVSRQRPEALSPARWAPFQTRRVNMENIWEAALGTWEAKQAQGAK